MIDDLSAEILGAVMPGRPIRSYPAILSTESEAMAWARAGAPEGAMVVAGYQVSPRGRAGRPWEIEQATSLAFSLIVHPAWPIFREGWLYTAATCGLADALGPGLTIEWPDELRRDGRLAAAVGVHVEPLVNQLWATITVVVTHAPPPRAEILAAVVDAIDGRCRAAAETVLTDYVPLCRTIGRRVRARMIPLGPVGPVIEGLALSALQDGALVLQTDEGKRIAVRPQHLGVLEDIVPVGERSA